MIIGINEKRIVDGIHVFFNKKVVYKKVVLDCSKVKKVQYWISESEESR